MNNVISLQQAITMTTAFREQKDQIVNPDLAGKNILPNYETFDRQAFDKVLSQSGCVQLRVYYGLNENQQLRAIVVGVNEKGEDMLPSEESTDDDEGNTIVEDGFTCPPICGGISPLNP
jgi:hypothetical protein